MCGCQDHGCMPSQMPASGMVLLVLLGLTYHRHVGVTQLRAASLPVK